MADDRPSGPPQAGNDRSADGRFARQVAFLGGLLLLLWLLYRLRPIVPLFVIGYAIAYVFDPALDWLQARRWPRSAAALLVFLVAFLALLLAALFIVPAVLYQVNQVVLNFDGYQHRLTALLSHWQDRLESVSWGPWLTRSLKDLSTKLQAAAPEIAKRVGEWLTASVHGLMVLLIVPIITYYFMQEIDPLRRKLRLLVPEGRRAEVAQVSADINAMLGRYLRGQLLVCLLVALTTWIFMLVYSWKLGLDYALTLALVAGTLCVVPYVGPFVTALSGALAGYLTTTNPWLGCVIVVGTLVLINQAFDSFITPRIVGRQVGLHPLVVIFALMAAGHLCGLLGMILAVPLAASLKLVLLRLVPKLAEVAEAK